jgi:hypothetical protein
VLNGDAANLQRHAAFEFVRVPAVTNTHSIQHSAVSFQLLSNVSG